MRGMKWVDISRRGDLGSCETFKKSFFENNWRL